MIINSEQEMLKFGQTFAKQHLLTSNNYSTAKKSSHAQVIELIGDVGVGKTTFVRGIALGLDINEPVTSPSFTISKNYALSNGGELIHYDFYRLNDPGIMLEDLSEKLADPMNIIIVEWGNSISNILPKERIIINLKYTSNGKRKVVL